MAVTRQHFALIAETLQRALELEDVPNSTRTPKDALRALAFDFSRTLASTNPSFNRARFLRACGVED
jgi:hypothetical protein